MATGLVEFKMDGRIIMSGAPIEGAFHTGSRGYRGIGKFESPVTSTVVFEYLTEDGSKGALALSPKHFSTGSVGFFGAGKSDDGKYQAQAQMVLIGSKADGVDVSTLPARYQCQYQMVRINSAEGKAAKAEAKADKGKTTAERELEKAAEFKRRADKRMAEAQAKAAKRGVDVQTVLNEETIKEMSGA